MDISDTQPLLQDELMSTGNDELHRLLEAIDRMTGGKRRRFCMSSGAQIVPPIGT